MKLKITNEMKEIIREIMTEMNLLPYLIEGIDIDREFKTVSFNPEHEENVNTSVILNPTYDEINGIEVISIFKRKDNDDKTDGNPLIYALKGIKGWKFKNPESDIINLLKQFIRIAEKIGGEYDTIITVPSSNPLNTKFLHRLNKIIGTKNKITDYFSKLSADEVWEDYIDWKLLSYDTKNKQLFSNYENMIKKAFSKMKSENGDFFSYKYIPSNIRKYIKKTMYVNYTYPQIQFGPEINNKRILILDDTISSGETISETCKEILGQFTPMSTTVITLFSRV